MVEIRQELGIDVSQAIRAVDNLDRRLASFGNALDNLATKLRNFNTAARRAFNLGNATSNLNQASDATRKVVRGFSAFEGSANNVASASNNAASGLNTAATAAQNTANATSNLGTTAGSLRSVTTAVQSFGVRAVAAFRNPRASITALGAALRNFSVQSSQAVGSITLSFQTLARIVSTQAIIRAINGISQAFTEGVSGAVEFQRAIAEIQTISVGSAFREFDAAADSVRRLSDAFNADLIDVAQGLREVVSQQIEGTANQVDVLTQSLVLARVGIASTEDSVALLTGILNSFQLEASEAESVAAVLFRTVDLGNTTISELSNSFGTVATIASETGASFEELAGAFAAVTINGVDTAKAATQIRGVFNAILKPTEELQAVFEEAGFSEGQLALETLGLVDTISLISDAANGSQTELAKLIPRLRGITAQLILGRDGADQFQRGLDEINRAAIEGIQEEFNIIINTDAERVTRALNELRNVLVVDIGQGVLRVLGFFTQFEGAIRLVTLGLQLLTPVLIASAFAFGVYAVSAGVAAAANTAFIGTAIRLLTIAGGIPAILAAGFLLTLGAIRAARSAGQAALDDATNQARQIAAERLTEARKLRAELLNQEKEGIRDRFRALTDFVREERSVLADRVKEWERTNEDITANTEDLLGRILDANRNLVRNLQNEAESAADAQIDSVERVRDLRIQADDLTFQNSLRGRNELQKAFLQNQRAAELGRNAAEQLAKAQTEAEIEAALAIAQRAQSAAQEAASTAESTGNRAAQSRALQTQNQIIRDLVSAEQRLQEIQADRQRQAEEDARAQEARVANLERAIERVLQLQRDFDPAELSVVDRENAIDEIQNALKDVQRLSVPEGDKLDASQLISFAKFRSDFINGIKISEAQGIDIDATLSGASLDELSTKIEDAVAEAFRRGINRAIEEGIDPNALTGAIGAQRTQAPLAAVDSLTAALNAERDRLQQVADNAELVRRSTEDLATATQSATAALNKGLTVSENLVQGIQLLSSLPQDVVRAPGRALGLDASIGFREGRDELRRIAEEAARVPLESFGKTEDQINVRIQSLNRQLNELLESLDFFARRSLEPQINRTSAAIIEARQGLNQAAERGVLTGEQLEQRFDGVKRSSSDVQENVKQIATEGAEFQGALNIANQNMNQIASNARVTETSLRNAAASAGQIESRGQTQTAAFGGKIHFFNRGGFAPKGTDTVPAMLTPGEFVVNAKSARRFFPQLKAINSGTAPRYFQEGGTVTNVGDINVTVGDSRSGGEIRAREIGRAIDREFRRKTSSIRRS